LYFDLVNFSSYIVVRPTLHCVNATALYDYDYPHYYIIYNELYNLK